MKWLYRNLYRKEKGFTLVELMIVIIILAILTGIAVPSYMVLRNRARTAAAQSEMKNIATALEMYWADNEHYPVGTAITAVESVLEADPIYMNSVPTTDPWKVAYGYTCATPGTTYTLTSNGGTTAVVLTITDGQPSW